LGVAQAWKWRTPLGEIEFFGYKGIDVQAIRAALPIHEGEMFPPLWGLAAMAMARSSQGFTRRIGEKVKQVTGREPTDVALVCCDSNRNSMVYIGLPGESSQSVEFNPAPSGDVRLPSEILKIDQQLGKATEEAILKGNSQEDDAAGYALPNEPAARKKALEMRECAVGHGALLFQTLASSSDANHRAIAARALGYGHQSNEQIDALVRAAFDSDDDVRNNAIRALAVLASAKLDLASKIPARSFIRLLRSGSWTDHNKAVWVLQSLSNRRDPTLLQQLRSEALDSLIEMARWRSEGHAMGARMILGRIAGIEEDRLAELMAKGQVDPILAALTPVH
jgi:hypothetical protein